MIFEEDAAWMNLAILEAQKCTPVDTAYCVGCVIVKDGKVVSTGYSRELPGNTHAEECALLKLKPSEAVGSIMYTTMEPCSIRLSGKDPCVNHVIRAGVARVVIGVLEPDHFVHCEGINFLEKEGIPVTHLEGLEDQCLRPNLHIPSIQKLHKRIMQGKAK